MTRRWLRTCGSTSTAGTAWSPWVLMTTTPAPSSLRCLTSRRARYLRERLAGKQPSYGQQVLGALVSGGQTDIVITTNFDELLETASAEAYAAVGSPGQRRLLNVAGLGSRDRARAVLDPDSLPMLIKLHGDFRESSLKNLDSELAEQDAVLRQAVHDLSRTYGLAVVGYSGRDDSIMTMLEAAADVDGAWPAGFWWFTRDPDSTPQRVMELLTRVAAAGTSAYVVRLGAFDELLGDLALQVQLPGHARTFVSQLQPPRRVTPAAPPDGRQGFPLIRYNALPILQAPIRALHASFVGLDHQEFRDRLRNQEYRGAAVMSGGSLWGWGDTNAFAALAGGPAETVTVDLTSAALAPGLHALALEGLTKALSARLPTRPKITRREYAVVLTEFDDLDERRQETLAAFKRIYGGQVHGHLRVSDYGSNRDGGPRAYAEAVRLHLEHRWGLSWLIFTPFTWVERWNVRRASSTCSTPPTTGSGNVGSPGRRTRPGPSSSQPGLPRLLRSAARLRSDSLEHSAGTPSVSSDWAIRRPTA
jgi:hypothetical protein